jgi:hypothetical protein
MLRVPIGLNLTQAPRTARRAYFLALALMCREQRLSSLGEAILDSLCERPHTASELAREHGTKRDEMNHELVRLEEKRYVRYTTTGPNTVMVWQVTYHGRCVACEHNPASLEVG